MKEEQTKPAPVLGNIMQIGLGFWASKTLLSAVELEVFTILAQGPLSCAELSERTGVHGRAALDFFDALVALGMLNRQDGLYSNTPDTGYFLDANKPTYAGGILEMANRRLFGFWNSLTDALLTGRPQNEAAQGTNMFATLYADPKRLETFLSGMTGISLASAKAIAEKFPWEEYETFADIGCAQGALPVQVAQAHPLIKGIGYDLPVVEPIFTEYVKKQGLDSQLKFQAGNFFEQPLPKVDVLVMGHILHDWSLAEKKVLIKKAYDALPEGGALVVYEALIDDDRSRNAFGLLMSLNMLIETKAGFDFTGADCQGWMREAGFSRTYVEHLQGPDSMVVAIK